MTSKAHALRIKMDTGHYKVEYNWNNIPGFHIKQQTQQDCVSSKNARHLHTSS